MRSNKGPLLLLLMIVACSAGAQVVAPVEIKDSGLRQLQEQNMKELTQAGTDLQQCHFNYPFYFSRKLDLDEQQQRRSDQHSVRFERYNNQLVLAVSGNYYAAYPGAKLSQGDRAKESFENVVVPILKAVVPYFKDNQNIQGYAVEISHHVLMNVVGMPMERPENLMVFLTQKSATKLVEAKDLAGQQMAVMDAQAFLNGNPIGLWLDKRLPEPVIAHQTTPKAPDTGSQPGSAYAQPAQVVGPGSQPIAPSPATVAYSSSSESSSPIESPKPVDTPALEVAPTDASPAALGLLQTANQPRINQMLKEIDSQAHFVAYAPPAFVPFRRGVYLEISLDTTLAESTGGSRYKLAALAFDEHIAHLIRPSMGYFKADAHFDGIAFSTTVHLATKTGTGSEGTEAVEFFFPFRALHCYESYDCTGQQLIDSGTVLINGERVEVDLQRAEAGTP
jgi:hypothetical protein